MIKRTFSDVKPELSAVAGSSGMAVTDARFLARLNRAIEELMNEGDWPGVVDRYKFAVYGGMITLPGDLNRIMGVAVNGSPVEMASPWFEFMAAGPGPQDSAGWVDNVIDRGEACTIQQIPADTPCTLEVAGELDERVSGARPKITLRGYNADGVWVRSDVGGSMIDGLQLEINGDTAPKKALTGFTFTGVEAAIKPRTKGYVHLYAVDGATRYHLATYSPNETNPSYRRYFVPFLDPAQNHQVTVRARKRFVPIRSDADFLIITNMGALEMMILALQARTSDIGKYYANKQIAVNLLKKEAEAYRGKSTKPVISFGRGFGMDGVAHVQ